MPRQSHSMVTSMLRSRTMSMFSTSWCLDPEDPLTTIISHIGEFGRYQKILFVAMIPFAASYTYVYLAQIFIIATPHEYWCKVPELVESIQDLETRKKLALPVKDGQVMKCFTWVTDWEAVVETMKPPEPQTPLKACTSGFEFDISDITYETVATEREWVCTTAYYVPLSQCFFFFGSVVGGLLTGWMADGYGRIPALVVSNLAAFAGGVGCIYTSGFWDFTLWRFIGGMGYDNCFIMVYILVLEYVGQSWRTFVANMSFSLYFGGFGTLLPLLAYSIKNWRKLMWFTSLPMLVGFIAPLLIPESASWLAARGYTREAVKILRKFERINNVPIPDDYIKQFVNKSIARKHNITLKTLLKSDIMTRALIMMITVYGASAVVYDGLMRLSESMGNNFFMTFALNSFIEIPANALIAYMMDDWGRQRFALGPMLFSAILSIFAAFAPTGILTVIFAVSSRFAIILSINGITQWATEILPTSVRASGNSLVHISGYVASALSPFIVFLDFLWKGLPYILMAIISLIGAVIVLFLPETQGLELPQSIEDGEKIIKNHRLNLPCFEKDTLSSNISNLAFGQPKKKSVTIKETVALFLHPSKPKEPKKSTETDEKEPTTSKEPTTLIEESTTWNELTTSEKPSTTSKKPATWK